MSRGVLILGAGTFFVFLLQTWRGGGWIDLVLQTGRLAFYVALAWMALRPSPLRVTVAEGRVTFRGLPRVGVVVGSTQVPLGWRKAMALPVAEVALEWIGGTLVLNDMEAGLSVRLAGGVLARDLAAWLMAAGVRPPVGA